MYMFQRYYIVFIQVLILCMKSPSLSGEYIRRNTRKIYEDSQITAEEIIRRQKLVEPHLLQIAEGLKDWIETYHRIYGAHESIPRKKVESSNNDLKKDPIQNEISSLDSNMAILEPEKFSDFNGKSEVPEILSNDPEKVHRLKIVEDDIPELKNLKTDIRLDHVDSTVMGNRASSSDSLEAKYVDQNHDIRHSEKFISTEEIIQRQKLVESHLLQIALEQKDWIETYNMIYGAHKSIPSKKVASSSNDLTTDPVENEISSLDSNREILEPEKFSDFNGKSEVPEILSNDPEKVHRLKIVEDYIPKLKNLEMGIGLDHVDYTIKGNGASSVNSVGVKYVDHSNEIEKHSEKFISANKFTDSSTEELTEMIKYKTESGYPPSYSNGQDKDFLLRENIKLTESQIENVGFNIKQNLESGNLNTKHSVLQELYLYQNSICHCSVGSVKDKYLYLIKELSNMKVIEPNICNVLPVNEVFSDTNPEVDYPIVKAKNTESAEFTKKDNLRLTEKSNTVPKGLHIREKSIESYISSLDKGKENWRETYDFNFKKDDLEENFKYAPVIEDSRYPLDNSNEVKKRMANLKSVGSQERLYFHRWLKKLLNKLIGHPYTEHVNIVFLFSPDSLNQLQKLSTSEKYEIDYLDGLITDFISNATISYDNNINSIYASISSVHFYIFVSILLSVLLFFALAYYPNLKILLIFIVCILWHGYKMYSEKVAEKHAILSASSSEYCNSILNKESGIFAHIKEFFRYNFYDEHCKKYFKALMIDPLSELSISIVISDFASSTFFQLIQPMARALNLFVKDVFKDLNIVQSIYLFFILIFSSTFLLALVLICNRYKLYLPFFMGSIEPTIPVKGSRVEDIPLEPKEKKSLSKIKNEIKSITKKFPLTYFLTGNNDKLLIKQTENYNFSLKPVPQTKTCRLLKRRKSC